MRRALKQVLITIAIGLLGALVSVAFWPHHVPILGIIIGGTLGYGFATVVLND